MDTTIEPSPKRRRTDHNKFFPSASKPGEDSKCDIYSELRTLRMSDKLTDITLKCGSESVRAHRCVLAASSEYFRACLTSAMKESVAESVLVLPLDDEDCLRIVTDHIYGENIDITQDNVFAILDSANQLFLDSLKEKCCAFLASILTVDSCLHMHYVADLYSCHELCEVVRTYICRNFEHIISSKKFLELSPQRLMEYVFNDKLSVRSECTVFQAVVKWIDVNPAERKKYMPTLLPAVRMELMSARDIAVHIHSCPYLCPETSSTGSAAEASEYQRVLLDAYRWHALPESSRVKTLESVARKDAVYSSIVVLGGDNGHDDHNPYNTVYMLDPVLSVWITLPPFSHPRSVAAAVCIQSKIYLLGGYDGNRARSCVDVLDLRDLSVRNCPWTSLAPLRQRRCSCESVVYDGCIYVIGGVCGPQALVSVEKYDPLSGEWMDCAPLQESRSACGATVMSVGGADAIFVCGGITTGAETVTSTECYSKDRQTWVPLAPMGTPRRSFGLCAYGNKVYAIGGNSGTHDLNSVEQYDPETNEWCYIGSLNSPRMFCSATVFHDDLYVIGGVNGSVSLNTVEVLRHDPTDGSLYWEYADPPLPTNVCGCGVATVNQIEYSLILRQRCPAREADDDGEEKVA
eukprot:CAMPEP_0185027776 /NCGR_PEP_ID=MMETSP1103-20130426/12987_1 /TAXON_ID=36769 /ORGANISM="Paraphysomonas bandaiensis, Strain Caron Lab Isolate" /LENGTH=632 /DNA_ID=CAMNT_0027561895 /DNA_START=85 /DNA_END=1983 /DNA_ORIENTATION=+